MKTWLKGVIIGLIPFVLTIILTIILIINIERFFSMASIFRLLTYLFIFYLFSFIFLVFAVLTGFVIHKSQKTKILVFLIVIIAVSSIFIYSFSGKPPSGEAEIYKGIWSPAMPITAITLLFDIKQLKEDGVNTLSFGPNYFTNDEGNIVKMPFMKQITILFIQTSHRNNFRVFLAPNLWGPGFTGVENQTLFFEQATDIVLEWAEIAEKYGVEMYAPSNEPAIIIPDKDSVNQWAHGVAVKVKEKYSGILVYKASDNWEFDNDYRGYDYVGLDIFPHDPEQTLEKFRDTLKYYIENGLRFAERDNTKGVILSEIGVQIKVEDAEDATSTTKKPFSLDYQKQAYEMFFEEGQNKVIGYVFCCWREGQFGPDNVPAEQVMKEWFNKIK